MSMDILINLPVFVVTYDHGQLSPTSAYLDSRVSSEDHFDAMEH